MLKRVSIQNFKSLKDVTLDLQKVNLLIGPNNSGKTNFLKVLEFAGTLDEHYNEIDNEVLFQKKGDALLKLSFVFDNPSGYPDYYEFYQIISRIHHPRSDQTQNRLMLNSAALSEFPKGIENITFNWAKADQYYIQMTNLHFEFGQITIYKPDPNKLTQSSIVGTGAQFVNADASNLIAFFDFIRDDQPDTFARIRRDLQKCVPEFTEINFQSIPSNDDLVKQFGPGTYKRLGLTDGKQGVKYWADELSEGTLYFLALLCIINQPNPPKLLLLEEPEKGIHPRRLVEVMQFILTLVEDKDIQVIMTTHSPIMVDMFKDMPDSVFIFDKNDEGATQVKNLQKDIIEPETARSRELGIEPPHYTDSLGDAWTVGFLGGVPK